ncbi:MAG: MotA/TolQ/ExbB proton channel family protein [Sandaracinaceae bacterium]|nr:MotA/TolQ/ExbB proton channel family protein [Sandaracinaceae bacterium]
MTCGRSWRSSTGTCRAAPTTWRSSACAPCGRSRLPWPPRVCGWRRVGRRRPTRHAQRCGRREKTLEARLVFLGTVGNNAPFVGLFGTVIGVILDFEELGHATATAGSGAASQVASGAVMSAIAEALVATAVGIAVALPAVAAYNFFQRNLAVLLDDAETVSNLVLAYLVSEEE